MLIEPNETKEPAMTEATAPASHTAADVAAQLGVDGKTFRRFLRSTESTFRPVGQGKRYTFTDADVKAALKEFPVWRARHSRKAKATEGEAMISAGDARAAALQEALLQAGLHVSQVTADA